MQRNDLCLVTNVSDITGSWIAKLLLDQGLRVRGTINLTEAGRADKIKEVLPGLELILLDQTCAEEWVDALVDVQWVFYIALPHGIKSGTAVTVTRLVLTAAFASTTIKKVVMTSSDAAIVHGHSSHKLAFTEDDWTNLKSKNANSDFIRAATLSEQLAWELYVERNPKNIGLSTVNPAMIIGPAIAPWHKYQLKFFTELINGKFAWCPDKVIHLVDVQDLAKMHISIMSQNSTTGFRHLSYALKTKLIELAKVIKRDYAECGYKASFVRVPGIIGEVVRHIVLSSKSNNGSNDSESAGLHRRLSQDAMYATKHAKTYVYEIKTMFKLVKSTMDSLLITGMLKPKRPIYRLGLGTALISSA